MISLLTLFWITIGIFAWTSFFRSWSKEVLALVSQLISLLVISVAAPIMYTAFTILGNGAFAFNSGQVFFGSVFVHTIFTFFAYQGSGLTGFTRRRTEREEKKLQERAFSSILGILNGYLFAGSILSFLEYTLTTEGWTRLPDDIDYGFGSRLTRSSEYLTEAVYQNLPLNFIVDGSLNIPYLSPTLLLVLVIAGGFLFFIIAE